MHDAYESSAILKLTVQIESMAAYGLCLLTKIPINCYLSKC